MLRHHNLSCLSVILHIAVFFAVTYTPPVYGHEGDVSTSTVSTVLTTEYEFQGVASGGSLILAESFNRNARFVSIQTYAGESAESVASRLAEAINQTNPFEWGGVRLGDTPVHSSGATLSGLLGGGKAGYMFAGSETGLGIPEPPLSVSCSYDQEKDQILVNWINPTGGYDRIHVGMNWDRNSWSGGGRVQGQSTSFVIGRKSYRHAIDLNDLYVYVIGFKNELPSNAGAIHVSSGGRVQEELFGIPFTNNISPNWTAWTTGANASEVGFEQVVRERYVHRANGRYYNPVHRPETKPFSQMIKTMAPNVKVGVWRKFLGLTPGHTYRISARLNTLEMDACKGNWSFSLHAAHNGPTGSDLTTQQLAGLAPLPDGGSGPKAGRIALYGPGMTTNGKWIKRSTDKPGPGLEIRDITLPAGVDTITVWVRHSGSDSTGVGIDWVKLQDLSILPDKSKR